MKIRHLLLGLMICVAGTGAIGLSGGFLDDQNTTQLTPFLIFGHVLYEGGAPCNNPNVSITNLNTGAAWYADTVSDSNFYQTLLTLADVNAGDVLRWSATDGTVFDTANRTVDQGDLESGGIFGFNITLVSIAPRITGYAPESQIRDIENAARRFNVTIDQVVDVTWLINSSPAQTNESVTDASYTHTNVAIGVWNVSARASNENGTAMQEWIWNVTTLPLPKIISFAPPSPVRDTENATRTFGITVDQVVDVTWLINGTEVFNKNHVNESSYTNISAALGVWNVTAVASNQNGTDAQEWIWHVNPPSPPPLDGGVAAASSDSNVRQPAIICGWVLYENGSRCIGPLVNISNLNTGMQWQAQTHPDHYYYQLVLDSANVSAGDMVLIDASKNGTSVGDVTHTVNQAEIEQGAIEVDINKRYLPDFTVTNLTFDLPDQLMIGDLVMINATIANPGASEGKASVEFYDNKNITIKRILNDYLESPINDTIRLPDVKRIRVHFESFDVSSMGNITIYNETRLVERITRDGWTKWCDGDTIRIQSCNAGFTIDRYEAVLADEPILVGAENSTNIPAVWNLSDQSMGWAVHGSHNITVRVDPHDQVIESNETNNEIIEVIDVHPSLDFAVTNMSLNPSEPVLGEVVGVSANIANYGVRNGTAVVGVYYDNRSIEIKRDININETTMKKMKNYTYTDNISLPSGVLGARLHFKNLYVVNGHVDICDNNGRVVERIGVEKNNYWTDCIYTDNITVRTVLLYITGMGTYKCNYIIDGYEALIAEEPVTLNATESKAIDASWLTGAAYGGAREHNITVMVDPRNHSVETNETNNTRSEEIFVNGTDLAVTEIEIPCGSSDNPCYVGQYVDITATIANIGTVDVTDFTVVFKDGACLNCSEENMNRSGVIFNETHIERLNSSENMTISVIWNPAEINNHTITARIPYEATDSNETNNELSDCSDVEARYDFSVERVNVGPPTAEKGESVNITATVGCTGYAGGNVSIAFFVNSTDFTGTLGERFTRIGTIDDVPLEVNETKTVSMRWDANVVGGYHLIAAVVNPENELEEINPPGGTKSLHDSIRFRGSDTGNNVKNCTLHVIPLDLNITDLTLVPSKPNIGDVVDVTTEIRNNGDVEANSTVWFYMERNESIAEKSSSEGSWQWRTALQPEVPMRFHFDYIEIYDYAQDAGGVNAYVTDGHDQKHPVYFYVKCGEKYGGQYAKTHGICLDTFGYESVIYLNCSWKRWNDVWTDWDNGTAFELDAGHNVRLSIDKYQVRLGNRTVTLSADESGLYDAEWNTSLPLKPGKNYTILANVENQRKESKETYLGGTDLVVTDLSVKPVVWDGEAVRVNATIENLGRMDAAAFTVNFTERYDSEEGSDYNTTPITKIDIEGLNSGNSTNISVLWNARIREIRFEGERYVWFEIADDYTIIVEIDPLENLDIKEEDSTNYSLERCVHVDYSRDFNVTDLSFSVNGTACDPPELDIYDDVTLNATVSITDILNQNGSVDVGFFIDEVSDEHKIGSYSITFDGGNGTGYAEIEWSVTCPPGDHDVIVMADPEEKIQEISETNNNLTQKIFVNAPELVLESLDVHPRDPEREEMVSINVTITNIGRRNTSDVTLCIYEWAERHIENLCEQSGPGREQIEITREDATAMRLYLDLEAEYGCKVCVSDGSGSGVICYDKNFHGWTPWIFDNSTTVVVTNTETKIASARVGKVYYIAPAPSSIIDTSVHDLGINETKNVMVNWSTSVIGEQFITAIVDPEDYVTEYNESNNRLAEFISVQTADLIVSNLSLTWINGTEISENDTIKHGDNVTITTDIANTGVEGAGNFSVRVLIGDILIKEETISGLANGSTIPLDTNWSATVGCHLINVEADWENEIDETNETNNIVAWGRHVSGAELSGDISWETLGLHGEILFGPTEPYDEDEVVITATINNSGSMPAANLSAAIFFDYTPFSFQKRCRHTNSTGEWINKTYPDAEYIYLNVTTPVYVTDGRCMIKDDVIVYDGNGSEVARPQKSCSVLVNGDTVDVNITPQGYSSEPVFDIYFYPIYQNETSKLFEAIDVPVNSSYNISMNRTVSVGNFTIMAVIDPGNKAPEDEDHRVDNVMSRMMSVKPTRDFTVTNVTAARTNLLDLDKTEITAEVSNIGLRNGTTNVSFVDCEGESRTYKYHFDANRTLSYLPIPPDATLSGFQYDASPVPDIYHAFKDYENLTIIHRPGMDAIVLHFDRIILKKPSMDGRIGVMSVRDENETEVWIKTYRSGYLADVDIRVPGETAYIHSCKTSFVLDGYTAEKELLKEEVRLNSTKDTNESKNITSMWTAYTGDHTIAVTLDGDDRITEISESNNELSPLFHVNASRDPAIVELNINPENPMDGDDVDISAIIANNGSRNASFTFDLWANTTRNKNGADEPLPDANLITDLGDRIRYIRLLKHANLTLAPGENVIVNATWNDISVFGSPKHRIIAIVDPLDEIDEMNESNNEIDKEIIMAYPDLTVGRAYVHGGTGKPVVNIKEIGGISGASDVTVRFESYETVELYSNKGCGCIHHPGADNMQVYFEHIDARGGYVEVGGKRYSGREFSDVWSPWVEGDLICIKCRGGGTWVDISEYRWGNVSDAEQFDLPAGGRERVEIPWTEYREPYDLTITVDPDNNITELDEDNNNKTIRQGADIHLEKEYIPKYLLVDHPINYIMKIKNEGMLDLPEFNVTLYAGLSADEMVPVENHTIEEILKSRDSCFVKFEWEPPIDGSYNFTIKADPEDKVIELDESDNNYYFNDTRVFKDLGYAGSYLKTYADGEVNGSFIFKMGDRAGIGDPEHWYQGSFEEGHIYEAKWDIPLPTDASIEIVRLYLYWGFTTRYTQPTEFDVKFNDRLLTQEPAYPDYSDYPIEEDVAFGYNYAYGVHCYDVKDYFTGSDDATVAIRDLHGGGSTCIAGMSLLIVYESDEGTLTKYWINEGADVLGCGEDTNTPLLPDECTTEVIFEGDADSDGLSNATLITVVPWGNKGREPVDDEYILLTDKKWAEKRKNGLYFNGKELKDGAYICDSGKDSVGIDERDVKDDLVKRDNVAEIQDRGDGMMLSANGFLILRYPPDLNIINLTAPASTVVGAHHPINVTIRNDGRSDAHDFNVTFHIDGKQMVRVPHLDLPAGENMTLHLYNWTPMTLVHVYNLTAAADVLSGEDWTELETDNNAMTKYVTIEEGGFGNQTGPRGTGGGSNPTGGEYTEKITGRVMQGMKDFLSLGGGGGAGMFSLTEWIMKGAVWFVLLLFVCIGYFMEQRSYVRVSAGVA